MKQHKKSPCTAAATTAHGCSSQDVSHQNTNILTYPVGICKSLVPVGTYTDPEGRWPAMPVYDMPEETAEYWNAKAARLEQRKAMEHTKEAAS